MRLSSKKWVITGLTFLVIGFIVGVIYGGHVGVYVSLLYIIGASALGVVFSLMQSIWRYFSTPSLDYGAHPLVNESNIYFLRVRKTGGSASARKCEALMTIIGTDRGDTPTLWEHTDAPRFRDISTYADLYLFSIDRNRDEFSNQPGQSIIFYSASDRSLYLSELSNRVNYEDYLNRTLRVTLVAEYGRTPKPYSKRVSDIMNEVIRKTAE